MRINLKDGISDELNTPIRLRWAIRTFAAGLILGALFLGGKTAVETVIELDEWPNRNAPFSNRVC